MAKIEPVRNTLRPASALSRRRFLQLSGVAGAGLWLQACGGGGGAPSAADGPASAAAVPSAVGSEYTGPAVELAFWNGFTGGDGPLLLALVEQFNSENENITVSMNAIEWADFYSTVPQAVTSGEGPQLGIMHLDQLATNAARGVITSLDPLTEVLGLSQEDFPELVWNAGVYNDQRYGIPLDIHPLGFYYNRALMEQAGLDPESPPQNREDFDAALEAFQEAGIQGHWVSPFLFTGGLEFQSLLPQFGGQMYDQENAAATWASEPAIEVITYLRGLIEAGHSPSDVAQDGEHVAFQNGDNAFVMNGIWQINAYRDTPDLDWGVAPIPQLGPEGPAAWGSSHNFVIFEGASDDVYQASSVFINYMSQNSVQWAEAGQIPARASVRDSEEFAALEEQSILAQQLDYIAFLPPLPGIGDAQGTFEDAFNAVMLSGDTDAFVAGQETATQLLQQAAEQYGA